MTDSSPEENDQQPSPPPVRIVGFEKIVPQYANDVSVSFDPFGFHLIFTRFIFPPTRSNQDIEQVQEQGYLRDEVVASIILPPLVAEQLVELLSERLPQQQNLAGEFSEARRRQKAEAQS